MSKIIIEDTRYYNFKKIKFKELTEGQMFLAEDEKLFIKTSYCGLIDNYASSLSDGAYTFFSTEAEVYPVDCEITFKRILQEASGND